MPRSEAKLPAKIEAFPSFWRWLGRGLGGKAGWRKYADRWLLLHLGIGALAAWLLPVSLAEAAKSVLLPLAGIFVGMSFAWVGNAQAIIQTPELERLGEHHPNGVADYVYTFQSAILAILVTLVLWGLAGLEIFDQPCPWGCPGWLYEATAGLLFAMASLTLRECWQVVMGAQWLLLTQRNVKQVPPSDPRPDPSKP